MQVLRRHRWHMSMALDAGICQLHTPMQVREGNDCRFSAPPTQPAQATQAALALMVPHDRAGHSQSELGERPWPLWRHSPEDPVSRVPL
jgi:hypothetical protein